MKFRIFLSFLTIALIAVSGLALKALSARQAADADAVSSATLLHAYGGKDYNTFLDGFHIPASEKQIEVITLHLGNDVFVLLVNTSAAGGSAIAENMSRPGSISVPLSIPCNTADPTYLQHTQAMAGALSELGYAVTLRLLDPLYFRSMVHSGHFDIILLEKRSLS